MSLSKIKHDIRTAFTGTSDYTLLQAADRSDAYGIDLEFLLQESATVFRLRDADGIPMVRFVNAGDRYMPTRIIAYGLAHINRFFLHSDSDCLEKALLAGSWLMNHRDALWYHDFDYDDLRGPWLSAMAQGEGISLLIRLHKATGEDKYIDQSIKALEPLKHPIEQGGVRSKIDGKHEFLEEYPSNSPRHTLNGFIYCLIGLLELEKLTGSVEEQVGLSALVETISTQIHRWDIGYWTTYDLHLTERNRRNAATATYHQLHTSQAAILGRLTGDDRFVSTWKRWASYSRSPVKRIRALGAKIAYRLENPTKEK